MRYSCLLGMFQFPNWAGIRPSGLKSSSTYIIGYAKMTLKHSLAQSLVTNLTICEKSLSVLILDTISMPYWGGTHILVANKHVNWRGEYILRKKLRKHINRSWDYIVIFLQNSWGRKQCCFYGRALKNNTSKIMDFFFKENLKMGESPFHKDNQLPLTACKASSSFTQGTGSLQGVRHAPRYC